MPAKPGKITRNSKNADCMRMKPPPPPHTNTIITRHTTDLNFLSGVALTPFHAATMISTASLWSPPAQQKQLQKTTHGLEVPTTHCVGLCFTALKLEQSMRPPKTDSNTSEFTPSCATGTTPKHRSRLIRFPERGTFRSLSVAHTISKCIQPNSPPRVTESKNRETLPLHGFFNGQ